MVITVKTPPKVKPGSVFFGKPIPKINNDTVAEGSLTEERIVLTDEQMQLQTSIGERYIYYYDLPMFWRGNLFIAAKLATRFRKSKPAGVEVKAVQIIDNGKKVAIHVRVTENSPTIIAVGISIAAVAIAVTIIFTMSKVEKVIDKGGGGVLATIATGGTLMVLAIAAVVGLSIWKR